MPLNPSLPHVAVVGCGYWGVNLVRNFYELGALKAVCDSNPQTLLKIEQSYPGVETYSSLSELLAQDGLEAVALATPAPLHAAEALEVLKAGLHLMVEKPLTLDISSAMEASELAESKNLILMVDHLLNRHPAVVKIKEMVSEGRLGKICHIYSRRLNLGKLRTEENVIWSFAPHDVALITSILGLKPLFVRAFGGSYLTQGLEDIGELDLRFQGGVTGHIAVSWLNPFKEQKLTVVGLEGALVFEDSAPWPQKLIYYPHSFKWSGLNVTPVKAEAKAIELTPLEPLKEQCHLFLSSVLSGQSPPDSHSQEGLTVLKILMAAERSLKSGQEEKIETINETKDYFAHPTAIIDPGVTIGRGVKIWHFSHILSGSNLGPDSNLGQNVVVGPKVKIGRGCKIQNNVSLYEGVELEDEVFCGPSMVFTNVNNPRAFIGRMGEKRSTLVGRGATIGANATVVCGHNVGKYAFIGAGATLTTNAPDHALMVGVPAKRVGWVCRCAVKLDSDLKCPACFLTYRQGPSGLELIESD
ncbi:MAG: Gfo/Idh/MocA family oxidoreductase [Deltaproteobacteria bacterium]|jgi:UDP-2-acetamido-3-amino-2,3-dideoxy-glucuronate N-acetyltransferase|nr:Gfo/Idh/MocA family oxidoreductase [Deltaproteobacteria bacterium]